MCVWSTTTTKYHKTGFSGFRASKDVKAGLWSVTAGFTASKDVKAGLWSVTKHGGRVAARQSTSNQGFDNVRVRMLGVLLTPRVSVRSKYLSL